MEKDIYPSTFFYSAIPLEWKDDNTLIYLGGQTICGPGSDSYGINIPFIGYYKGSNRDTSSFIPLEFTPAMSEWEVFDQTTNSPVKIK
jgi:hypothetical protein